jgi:Leucine-rich repeat (LRR) protein
MDVFGADLGGKNITAVAGDDAAFILRLATLDLSDNRVELDQLASFPALRALTLQCNSLRRVGTLPTGAFPQLEKLDLSVNSMPAADLSALAQLKCLTELDVSSNGLASLPPMSGFKELTTLSASNNRLQGGEVLAKIGAIPKLQNLALQGNSFDSLGLLIRAAADAADAVVTGGYRGPWHTLAHLDIGNNRITGVGGLDVLLALPALATLVVRGNPAFTCKPSEQIYALRQVSQVWVALCI